MPVISNRSGFGLCQSELILESQFLFLKLGVYVPTLRLVPTKEEAPGR